MADPNKAAAIDALLRDLSRATIGTTFNQFREVGPEDVPGAPDIRLANLGHYLEERAGADILAVGEAAGSLGARWSGVAFSWGLPYRGTSTTRKGGWSEPSGTIVHGLLEELGAERRVILWNTVPFHPHQLDEPLSNRRPTGPEIAMGTLFAERLIDIVRPRLLVGVGRIAAGAVGDRAVYVRHPAQAGATAFRLGMRGILAQRPG